MARISLSRSVIRPRAYPVCFPRRRRIQFSAHTGYRFHGWRLERRNRRLVDPGGTPIPLTKCEYALLLAFVQAPQRPLTREQLLQATDSMKISSIGASMFRFCGCGESWRSIRVRTKSSRPSEASAISSPCRSSRSELGRSVAPEIIRVAAAEGRFSRSSQLDFEAWRAFLQSKSECQAEVAEPQAFAVWMRSLSICGLTALEIKLQCGSAAMDFRRLYGSARTERDVRRAGADWYTLCFSSPVSQR